MKRLFFFLTLPLLLPLQVLAAPASFSAAQALFATSSSPGNAYTAGASVVITAPTASDLTAVGGSIVAAGPVAGDGLLIAGSINVRAPIKGDLRALGGTVVLDEAVGGDLVAFGYSVRESAQVGGSVFVIAANTSLDNGAAGEVTIYGNNVALAGEFMSNVRIVAGGSVTLAPDTVIHGKFAYEAPDTARVPASVTIVGGTEYTNASYLPDIGASRTLALASLGIFLLVRILGALILAGLFAGLFPILASAITERVYNKRIRSILLTTLLGFAALVATPILLILLALTFVGIGIALILGIAYTLLISLAFIYAGILIGALLVRRFSKRIQILWHDGVLGMLALSLVALIPIVGWIIVLLLMAFTTGTLLMLFFQFAFPQD